MAQVESIPLDLIKPSPFNVRQNIDTESLAQSIDSVGQIEPVRVRPVEGGYEIRTGMRRFIALQKNGATTVDALVVDGTDKEVVQEQWQENEEREDYTAYERALKLKQILDTLSLTQTELADRIGKTQGWVAQQLGILKLEEIITRVIIQKMTEAQARAILAAPQEDWHQLVVYLEHYKRETGDLPPASDIRDYAHDLEIARDIEAGRQRFLSEIPSDPGNEAVHQFVVDHELQWILDEAPKGTVYLTKLGMLSDEELTFCLAHETRPESIRRLNELKASREEQGEVELAPPKITASITRLVGAPVEQIQQRLIEEHDLTEEEATEALDTYRATFPDIGSSSYDQEPEPPLTAEEYVQDILRNNPEVDHEQLIKATVDLYGVSDLFVKSIIDGFTSSRRGRPPSLRSPVTTCPLCGYGNAEKNRLLMVLEETQESNLQKPLVEWLREVLA